MRADLAIDLGSVNTRLANAKGRVLYEQPTLVACHLDTGKPERFGSHALGVGAQSAGRLRPVHPVARGQLADVELAQALLEHVIEQVGRGRFRRARVLATVPLDTTPVQLRAMSAAFRRAGIRTVRFLEQPIASALGARVAVEAPLGSMVIDVGGEITNLAVIALGGVVLGSTVPCGGETFDRSVAKVILSRLDLVIDRQSARRLRREYGSVSKADSDREISVIGRDRMDGSVRVARISQRLIGSVLEAEVQLVLDAARRLMMECPPDLANDLVTSGVVLAGGGSQLDGFAERLATQLAIPVHVFEKPSRLAVLGAARCLGTFRELEDAFTAPPSR